MINKKFKIAAVLMIIHGAMMEALTGIAMFPLAIKSSMNDAVLPYIFAIDFFRENILFMLPMAVIFGVTRVIGAVALLKNLKWGFVLSVINCIVTMNVMLFMIPSGIADGIFACTALILLLCGYFGKEKINKDSI